jgi:hypothetical protein
MLPWVPNNTGYCTIFKCTHIQSNTHVVQYYMGIALHAFKHNIAWQLIIMDQFQ